MKFENISLIIATSIISIAFITPVQAEKLQNLDAIWDMLNVADNKTYKKSNKNIPAKVIHQSKTAQKQKRVKAIKLQHAKKKQNNVQNTKLARQRAAWKAKWDAQQKAKGQPLASKKQVAPKKLTRAQYQQRFKQAQLKKQRASQITAHKKTNTPPQKLTKAQYQQRFRQAQVAKNASSRNSAKQNKAAAIYNKLPTNIVSKLRATGISERGMSAYVLDVNSPRPLLAHKDTTSRVPASVMKLITSYAALGTLGPNYRWPTDVLTKGVIRNGTLQGDLIVKGYGNPEFKTADLRKVLKGIRQRGIHNISGRVVFDNSYFNAPKQRQGSFDGRSLSHYNAKPDALLFNERLSTFNVRALNKSVKITPLLPTANLKIVNNIRKSKRSCKTSMRVSHKGQQTVLTFSGRFAKRCGTRSYTKVISKPAEMIYGAMRAYWKKDVGGTLNTRFAMGRVPAGSRLLFRTHSRTLAQILPEIDKDSNNVMARQLLLTIGAKRSGGVGTEQNGANAIGTWLASRGLHFPELRIENGSGLSRTARISARHMGDLLVDAYRSPYRNHLMQALAVAGVDGTMKKRLKHTQVRGRGYFKTGTLRDVRSIAGYVKAADGKIYVMAILHNDSKARKKSLAAHDELIKWVYQSGGRPQLAMR